MPQTRARSSAVGVCFRVSERIASAARLPSRDGARRLRRIVARSSRPARRHDEVTSACRVARSLARERSKSSDDDRATTVATPRVFAAALKSVPAPIVRPVAAGGSGRSRDDTERIESITTSCEFAVRVTATARRL